MPYGVVQSWSPTQIVAQVAPGAVSGDARVLQNGVWTASVPFTVNTINLTDVTPLSGSAGSTVTFTGSGFGVVQGTGAVWLGSAPGQVLSWSDTTVTAAVSTGTVTGIARIQQGTWSKAFSFTVPGSGGSATTLTPNLLTMEVGDTSTLQALNATGQPVTGLTWTSSNPAVVSLSTSNPPVLTALAPGRATVIAGGASADVTVSAGPLPVGTVLWSNTGNFDGLVPAVPSPTGVADVFAVRGSAIQAITKDGVVAWTANVGSSCGVTPDFQGGAIVQCDTNSFFKLDGLTGQAYPSFSNGGRIYGVAIHPDGTVFTLTVPETGSVLPALVGVDPVTGSQKFSIPIVGVTGLDGAGNLIRYVPLIAGDGFAYLPYATRENCGDNCEFNHLKMLRADSAGVSSVIRLMDWRSGIVDVVPGSVTIITNADTGVLLAIWTNEGSYVGTTTGTSVNIVRAQMLPGQSGLLPELQMQDGSFVGQAYDDQGNEFMVAFDASGSLRWSVPNEYPVMATAEGRVIGFFGAVFDRNGSAIGQVNLSTQSWTGNEYETSASSIDSVNRPPVFPASASFAPQRGANPSRNGTAFAQCGCLLQSAGVAPLGPLVDAPFSKLQMEYAQQVPAITPPLKTFVILEGDPGQNRDPQSMYNTGTLFHLAALTYREQLAPSPEQRNG